MSKSKHLGHGSQSKRVSVIELF